MIKTAYINVFGNLRETQEMLL